MTLNTWLSMATVGLVLTFAACPTLASPIVSLGAASDFSVLAGTAVTSTGNTTLDGDVAVYPDTAITGFGAGPGLLGPGIVNGTQYAGGTSSGRSAMAQASLATAYNVVAGLACGTALTNQDLGTAGPLKPGVYCFASSAQLTGTLVLDEQGANNQEFVFQIASALTTGTDAAVIEIDPGPGGVADNNIFWQVGSSATLGSGTAFVGDILALTSITLDRGANISCGAALAQTGAVTLDDNVVASNGTAACQASVITGVVEPQSFATLGVGLLGIAAFRRRRSAVGLDCSAER